MKKITKILILSLVFVLCVSALAACNDACEKDGHKWNKTTGKCDVCGKDICTEKDHTWLEGKCIYCDAEYEFVDYVAQCKLDRNSGTAQYTAKNILKMFVDGDTTHFNVPTSIDSDGVFKARYLAVNTPESTGQVEPFGKRASNFTHKTLQDAVDNGGDILLESDTGDGKWNSDSYGRFLSWVWYKPDANSDWRNLNLELLQNGLGYGSNPAQNRYGEYCVAALHQANVARLVCFSQQPDPDFYYGDAVEIDLRELRTNFELYEGKLVAFEGIVVKYCNGSSYVQSYSEEDDLYYGIPVYYNGSDSDIKEALAVGSRVRVVGNVGDFNGTKQVSSIRYNAYKPEDPRNTILLDKDNEIECDVYTVPEFFSNKTVRVYNPETEEDKDVEFRLAELIWGSVIKMENLTVKSCYTTASGQRAGAISIYCQDDQGNEITVRTEILYKKVDGKSEVVKQSEFEGKTITVYGLVDYYGLNGHDEYQLLVVQYSDIEIVD